MLLELPDVEGIAHLRPEELRLELACGLYRLGRLGKVAGAELAGLSFFEFQGALGERGIESYTREMLAEDMTSLESVFPG